MSGLPAGPMDEGENLRAALDCARRGYHVMPACWGDDAGECACPGKRLDDGTIVPHEKKEVGKAPIGTLVPRGVLDATKNSATLTRWWERHPRANVAVALGPSSLMFIDPDSDEARADAAARGLPPTAVRHSKNVGYLYLRPPDCPSYSVMKGGPSGALDVMAAGYAIVHGVHATGAEVYVDWLSEPAPAPAWSVELVTAAHADREERTRAAAEPRVVEGVDREPPVRLRGDALERWRGERFTERAEAPGTVDRSKSLVALAGSLHDAGASRDTIADALAERDETLDWRKYSERRGGGALNYVKIAEDIASKETGIRIVFDDNRPPSSQRAGTPWPEPARVLGLPPAPMLDLALFPPEIANVALDASDRLQCPPDYVAWSTIVSMAGLIGRGAGIRPRQLDDWTERACLWVALIGEPSWMKSPALQAGLRSLRRQEAIDRERFEQEHAAWEAECDAILAQAKRGQKPKLPPQPVERRWSTSDATIEKLGALMVDAHGLTLVRDELAGWVGSFNRYTRAEGDRQFYLECYSGGRYTVDRVGRGTLHIPDTYLDILGGVQPDRALDIFGAGPDDGFAARVTAIYSEMPAEYREVDRWPDKAARNALDTVSDRLVAASWSSLLLVDDWKPLPFCRLAPDAGAYWSEWHTGLMAQLRGGAWEGRHAGRVGKYAGLAARLALVWHLVEWGAGRVADDRIALVPELTMAKVLDLMTRYIAPMDARVYRAFDRSQAANGGERIARWIIEQRPASFTLREIRRHGWSGLTEPDAVEAATEWLAAMGWVREADPEQRAGRPSSRFDVNPRAWEAEHVVAA